jgi:hypothetical protein
MRKILIGVGCACGFFLFTAPAFSLNEAECIRLCKLTAAKSLIWTCINETHKCALKRGNPAEGAAVVDAKANAYNARKATRSRSGQ